MAKRAGMEGLNMKGEINCAQTTHRTSRKHNGWLIIPLLYRFGLKKTVPNALFMVQGFREKEKGTVIYSFYVRASSLRPTVTLGSVLKLPLCRFDVRHAYIQSDTKLARDVDIILPVEMKLGKNILLRDVKALDELTDVGDYWYKTLRSIFVKKM